jgi:thymidylate kinase
MELKSSAFHKKVRNGYLALAKKEPVRIKVVKVEGNIEDTQAVIRNIIDKHVL